MANQFISDIERSPVTENSVRAVLGLTATEQDGIVTDLSLTTNILTVTKLDGTTSDITLPGAADPTEGQIRTALGFTSAEQMATFIDAVYNTGTSAIDFTQEDGSTLSVSLPASVDEHVDAINLNTDTGELTFEFSTALLDIVIDLSSIITIDDSLHIPPTQLQQGSLGTIIATPVPALDGYFQGLEIIFETENTNASLNATINVSGVGTRALVKADGTAFEINELPNGRLIRAVYHGIDFITDIEPSTEVSRTIIYDFVRTMVLAGDNITVNLDPVGETITVIGQPAEYNETLAGDFQRAETVRFQATPNVIGTVQAGSMSVATANPIGVLYGEHAANMLAAVNGSDRITVLKKGIYSLQYNGMADIATPRSMPRLELFHYADDPATAAPIGRTTSEYMRLGGTGIELTLNGWIWVAEDNTDIRVVPSNEWSFTAAVSFQLLADGILVFSRLSEAGVPIERLEDGDRPPVADADSRTLYVNVDADDGIEQIKIKNKVDDYYIPITPATLATGYIGYATAGLGTAINQGGGTSGSTKLAYFYERLVSTGVYQWVIGINDASLGDFAENDFIYLQLSDDEDALAFAMDATITATGVTFWSLTQDQTAHRLVTGTEFPAAIFSDASVSLETAAAKRDVFSTFVTKENMYPQSVSYEHLNMPASTVPYNPGQIYPGEVSDFSTRVNLYQDRKFEIGNIIRSTNHDKPMPWLDIRSGARGNIDIDAGEISGSDLRRGTVWRPSPGDYRVNAEVLLETGVVHGVDIALVEAVLGNDRARIVSIDTSGTTQGNHRFSSTVLTAHGKMRSRAFRADGTTDFYLVFGLSKIPPNALLTDEGAQLVWRGADFSVEWIKLGEI